MTGFIRIYRGVQLRCFCDRDSCEGCATFETFFGRITNADRIREMTDEELAGFIYDRSCAYCPMEDCFGRMTIGRDACYKRWLDWLKQEVENGNS